MDTVPLHAESFGDGPPLVVLHGLFGSGNNWRRHARHLARHYRLVVPDLRNHGRSPHHRRMDYPAMAADVAALMDREGLDSATIIGHSMGGKAALILAITQPARVRALVAADIAPVAYDGQGHGADNRGYLSAMQAVDLAALRSRTDADAALTDAVAEPMVRQFLLTNLVRTGSEWRWRIPLDTLTEALPVLEGWPEPEGRYPGPALFVHGDRSEYVTDAMEPAIRDYFPQAELTSLKGAGHWIHVDAPEAFMQTLEPFLRRSM